MSEGREGATAPEMTGADPYRVALAAQAVVVLQARPGLTIVQVARAMGVRMVLCWEAVAEGIEAGGIEVRDGLLWANDEPAQRQAREARWASVFDHPASGPAVAGGGFEDLIPEVLVR